MLIHILVLYYEYFFPLNVLLIFSGNSRLQCPETSDLSQPMGEAQSATDRAVQGTQRTQLKEGGQRPSSVF